MVEVQQNERNDDKQNGFTHCKSTIKGPQRRIQGLTCNSMDFIGLPLVLNEEDGLEGVLERTRGVKVAIIDSGHNSRTYPNEYKWFISRPPISRPVHDCEAETKLSSHGCICAAVFGGERQESNFFGVCKGITRGVTRDVQMFMYPVGCKTCRGTPEMLARAIDLAIKDRVRIISMSVGMCGTNFEDFKKDWTFDGDVVAKKTLEAFKNNILTCVPAGNEGPAMESLIYGMPWCINVGACAIGKNLVTKVTIGTKRVVPRGIKILRTHGNDKMKILAEFEGISMNIHESPFLPLRVSKKLRRDREAIVSANEEYVDLKPALDNHIQMHMLKISKWPLAFVSRDTLEKIRELHSKVGNLEASISTSISADDDRGIFIPEFSARGPSRFFPEIIMPDLVAPGCNILGSTTDSISIGSIVRREGKSFQQEEVFSSQRIMTGTSLANPHVAGLLLALMCARPKWSLSAVKSAAITTARSLVRERIPGDELVFGAGIMQLKDALNPGLVYDESHDNFERYAKGELEVDRLNMASFAASFTQTHKACERTFHRTLTNIDDKHVTYEANVEFFNKSMDNDASIEPEPRVLSFSPGGKMNFELKVNLCPRPMGHISALLIWKEPSTNHCVVSPIHLYHRSAFDKQLWYFENPYKKRAAQKPGIEIRDTVKGKEKVTGDDKGKGKLSYDNVTEKKVAGQKRSRQK